VSRQSPCTNKTGNSGNKATLLSAMCLKQVPSSLRDYIRLYTSMCMLTCSQKGKSRTALDGFPNVNPNLLCCLAYVHVRKTELSERSHPHTQVHFLFQCKPGTMHVCKHYTHCLASSAGLPCVYSSVCICSDSQKLLFHLCALWGGLGIRSDGLGMRLGRPGNEVGEAWE